MIRAIDIRRASIRARERFYRIADRLPGTVEIVTEPAGVTILVDGVASGKTSAKLDLSQGFNQSVRIPLQKTPP